MYVEGHMRARPYVHVARCVALGATIVTLTSSCAKLQEARPQAVSTVMESSAPPIPAPGTDWDNPIGGVEVPSLVLAEAALAFDPIVPGGLGDPKTIMISDLGTPEDGRVLAFIYDTEKYGRIDVLQRLPDVPVADYDTANDSVVAANDAPGTQGTAEIIEVRAGSRALLLTAPDGVTVRIYWLEDDVEIVVMGPALSRDQALQIVAAL